MLGRWMYGGTIGSVRGGQVRPVVRSGEKDTTRVVVTGVVVLGTARGGSETMGNLDGFMMRRAGRAEAGGKNEVKENESCHGHDWQVEL